MYQLLWISISTAEQKLKILKFADNVNSKGFGPS